MTSNHGIAFRSVAFSRGICAADTIRPEHFTTSEFWLQREELIRKLSGKQDPLSKHLVELLGIADDNGNFSRSHAVSFNRGHVLSGSAQDRYLNEIRKMVVDSAKVVKHYDTRVLEASNFHSKGELSPNALHTLPTAMTAKHFHSRFTYNVPGIVADC